MDDQRFGRTIRMVRVRRRWRQEDLAQRAGSSRATVWRVERGRLDELTIASVRRICAALDIGLELRPRGRGADLDRIVNQRHSALHESVARGLAAKHADWEQAHEVSFNVWGERGVIDLVLWHPGRRALLIVELKTELVDIGDLLATMDRRRRLAGQIVGERGWQPDAVSTWVIVARSRTNERRIADHAALLRSAFPDDQRATQAWLAGPGGNVRAISLWRGVTGKPMAQSLRVHRTRDEIGRR